MRYTKILNLLILALFPFAASAQVAVDAYDITGLWKGTIYNDTTKKELSYEIAISEHKGKLSGYSYTFYIIDDQNYYGVKKAKMKKQDGKLIVESVAFIATNFPNPPKNIKRIEALTLDVQDSIMTLSGPFTTVPTKDYRALTGSIKLKRRNDFYQSALVPHLEELGLSKELSFVQPAITGEQEVIVKTASPEPVKEKPVKEKRIKEEKPAAPAPTIVKAAAPVVPASPAADVTKRKTETIQSVYYKTDSLVLTLYDNGEVDGDTVSVLMNGNIIIPQQGLSTKAYRKTVYTKDAPDSIQLLMYAETLGSIPPNTGLLVVQDGKDIYEIRFSGDYQKNAAIIFRRKKN